MVEAQIDLQQKLHYGENWNLIEAEDYLKQTYEGNSEIYRMFLTEQLHGLFIQENDSKLKILDVGTGPSIVYAISAAQFASEIVLSDYCDDYRAVLQKWVDGNPTAHDWTKYLKYIVKDLEGKSEKEVKERETKLRKAIKAVVPCDITKDPPLPPEHMQQYDLVTSVLCLESACRSRDAYKAAVSRLYDLIKPGGRIALYSVEREDSPEPAYFSMGGINICNVRLQCNFIRKVFQEVGFTKMNMTFLSREEAKNTDSEVISFVFITAYKRSN